MALSFPDINPVAFSLGPVDIRWYALAYITGILIGWRYALHIVRKDNKITPAQLDDFLTYAIIGIILGGRLGYVLFYNAEYFLSNPSEILKIWHGGMAFHGGLLGVLASMIIFSKRQNVPLLALSDVVATVAPVGLFFGRVANFINGELFGRVTESPLGMIFPQGGPLPRHPSQLYEAVLEGGVLFMILFILSRRERIRKKTGVLSGIFLFSYGMFRAFIELFREPDLQMGLYFDFISMGQILSLPMIIGGLVIIIWRYKQSHDSSS